jgi:hypothetical protein
MLSVKDLLLVPNAPYINRVGEDVVDVATLKRPATGDAPIRTFSLFGSKI